MIVDWSARFDECIDIGDRDEHPDVSAAEILCHRKLVEIAGIVVVDGAPQEIAQIANAVLTRRLTDRRELLLGRCGKIGLETAIDHRLTRDRR